MSDPSLVFAISADYERRTGGWIYDQRLIEGLARRGWRVDRLVLPGGFPDPDRRVRAAAAAAFAALPDGTLVLADQLCLGVLPEIAAAEGRRLRLVMIVHHPLAFEEGRSEALRRRYLESERAALAHVAQALATSPTTARTLCRSYAVPPARMVVAPPGVDPLPSAEGSAAGPPSLLSVGAVVPRKDHGLLIEALAGLADRPWRLRIVGNTTRATAHVERLREQIDQLGLGERVELAGELDGAAFETAWRTADLFVAGSRHEGFGMAVAEALARGLAVVTTAAGAIGEWVDRRAALVVPVGEVAPLRAALARALDDRDLRHRLRDGARAARTALPRWADTATIVHRALLGTTAA